MVTVLKIMERGIIPAYAGNTSMGNPLPSGNGDHPRVCGEHVTPWRDSEAILGSSPRMRGTPEHMELWNKARGIIPAYAGNTRIWAHARLCSEDHPRVCGEHLAVLDALVLSVGSSPRMRGTHGTTQFYNPQTGIIPAYAGNTLRDYSNFVVSKFMSFVFHLV